MKKIVLLLIAATVISCRSENVEPIVLTLDSFNVKVDSNRSFGTNNVETRISDNLTFLTVKAEQLGEILILEIGEQGPDAPLLRRGIYSVNDEGDLIANIKYENQSISTMTENGFYRQIEITSIDFDSGIVKGVFSGILPGDGSSIHLNDGRFLGVFHQ